MVSRFGLPEGSAYLTPHKRGVSLKRIGDQTDSRRLTALFARLTESRSASK